MFDVNVSLIRYWESQFENIRPRKTSGGKRHYSQKDIDEIRLVYHLVKQKGMTLSGAQQKLRENRNDTEHNHQVIKKLQQIKDLLTGMRDEL